MATRQFNLKLRRGVVDTLRRLAPQLQKKYLRSALRSGAVIVQHAAQQRARAFDDLSTPQSIWKEIAIRSNSRLGKENNGLAYSIGVLGGARKSGGRNVGGKRLKVKGRTFLKPDNVYYWRFLEFGTAHARAEPFMRPALANNVERVTDTIVGKLTKAIDDLAKG